MTHIWLLYIADLALIFRKIQNVVISRLPLDQDKERELIGDIHPVIGFHAMSPSAPLINDGNVVVDAEPTSEKNGAVKTNGHAKQSESAVMHRSLKNDPLQVVSAQGHYLHLSNGEKIYDATGGAAVSCIGHGNER